MKHQYFGDENDFRKYGLLRILLTKTRLKLLVVWMLTKNDKGSDGKFRNYLKKSKGWIDFDKELYEKLQSFPQARDERSVKHIQKTSLLPNATYFSTFVPDEKIKRLKWRDDLLKNAKGKDLVFFDPDNGIETSKGTLTEKHLAWEEVKMIWNVGCSILIYQHFPRKTRSTYVKKLVSDLKALIGAPSLFVQDFLTSRVLFLLVSQKKHEKGFHQQIAGYQFEDRFRKENWIRLGKKS